MTSFRAYFLWVGLIFQGAAPCVQASDPPLLEEGEALGTTPPVAQHASSTPTYSHDFWDCHLDCGVCQYLESFIEDELRKKYTGFASHYVANTKSVSTPKEMLDAVMRLTN